jgi:hypothetical protein
MMIEIAQSRDDVIVFESLSKSNAQWKPFSATIRMPDGNNLSIHEKAVVGNALVRAAHQICEMRGLKPGEPFWIGPDNNDKS